jgi:hypothetical protein
MPTEHDPTVNPVGSPKVSGSLDHPTQAGILTGRQAQADVKVGVREPSDAVTEKQIPTYSDSDFRSDLDRVTRRQEPS